MKQTTSLEIKPILALKDNYIWLLKNSKTHYAAIVDPGEATPVLQYLRDNQLTLTTILITHHHFDHCGGIAEIIKHYQVPVYAFEKEPVALASHKISDQDSINLREIETNFTVIAIPGHTLGHVAYYYPGILFSGDTLFTGGCGRLFEGTAEQMYGSLKKLAALPEDTKIYCGHEYTQANLQFALAVEPNNKALQLRINETNSQRAKHLPTVPAPLKLEKLTNPFLRCHITSVITSAERYAGHRLANEVEVFSVLREWKNNF